MQWTCRYKNPLQVQHSGKCSVVLLQICFCFCLAAQNTCQRCRFMAMLFLYEDEFKRALRDKQRANYIHCSDSSSEMTNAKQVVLSEQHKIHKSESRRARPFHSSKKTMGFVSWPGPQRCTSKKSNKDIFTKRSNTRKHGKIRLLSLTSFGKSPSSAMAGCWGWGGWATGRSGWGGGCATGRSGWGGGSTNSKTSASIFMQAVLCLQMSYTDKKNKTEGLHTYHQVGNGRTKGSLRTINS